MEAPAGCSVDALGAGGGMRGAAHATVLSRCMLLNLLRQQSKHGQQGVLCRLPARGACAGGKSTPAAAAVEAQVSRCCTACG